MRKKIAHLAAAALFVAAFLPAASGVAQELRASRDPDSAPRGAEIEREELPPARDREREVDDPDAARTSSRVLGKAQWILVVNAVRGPKGELMPWDRDGEWAKTWRVPGDIDGTRYVPVSGDAEDREHVKPSDLTHLAGLLFLASKYRAPAVAVVVREKDEIAVAGWRGGASSGWSRVPLPAAAPIGDAKAAAVKMLTEIFPGTRPKGPDDVVADRHVARVLAFRDTGGDVQYQVLVQGRGSSNSLQRMIESVAGLSISEIVTTPDGYDIVLDDRSGSKEPVERRLSQAGLPTSPAGGQRR